MQIYCMENEVDILCTQEAPFRPTVNHFNYRYWVGFVGIHERCVSTYVRRGISYRVLVQSDYLIGVEVGSVAFFNGYFHEQISPGIFWDKLMGI